jgi:hypothetical protein
MKGIDLPKEEEALGSKWRVVIHLAIDSNGLVTEQDSYGGWHRTNIEAIQIPKDHGNIIDRDELIEHLKKDPLFSLVENYGITGVIKSRPVILEEEEES